MTRFAYPEGVFCIDPIPAQPQIAHCHGFFVPVTKRGRGHAHTLKTYQMCELIVLGYDYATATVDSQNAAQIKVLTRAGWQRRALFPNSKTGGTTELWGCQINQEQP